MPLEPYRELFPPVRIGYDGPQDAYYILSPDGKRRLCLPKDVRVEYLMEGGSDPDFKRIYGKGCVDDVGAAAIGAANYA